MAKLPPWSWLLAGLAIAITSWKVEMPLFFWLGWIFVIIGITKFLIMLLTSEKTTKTERRMTQQYAPIHQAHTHQYYRCQCGNPARATDRFCNNCGRRLR